MDKQRILTVRFGDVETDSRDFMAAWHALESGEQVEAPAYALAFESLDGFLACLTGKRWELLHVLRQQGPCSIRRLANTLCRDYKNVHTDVQQLYGLGLLMKDDSGRIYVPWDEIDARIPLAA